MTASGRHFLVKPGRKCSFNCLSDAEDKLTTARKLMCECKEPDEPWWDKGRSCGWVIRSGEPISAKRKNGNFFLPLLFDKNGTQDDGPRCLPDPVSSDDCEDSEHLSMKKGRFIIIST